MEQRPVPAGPRPPCRHLFAKTGGSVAYFEDTAPTFIIRPSILVRNGAFLLSTVARYLNISGKDLAELFRVARRTLMNAVPTQQKQIQRLKREQVHMPCEDAAAFEMACICPLEEQIIEELGTMADFSSHAQFASRGAEALVSRADFFGHVLPCAKRMFPDALYGHWIDYLLEFNQTRRETKV